MFLGQAYGAGLRQTLSTLPQGPIPVSLFQQGRNCWSVESLFLLILLSLRILIESVKNPKWYFFSIFNISNYKNLPTIKMLIAKYFSIQLQ